MKKLALLATTILMMNAPMAHAEEQSWIDTMKQSVQQWWSGDEQTSEVEAYLDEVTIAVPPMTGEEAAQIQPAAGDYIEETQEEMMKQAPGSMMNDEQSFNTNFTNETVTAFEDNVMSADDLANIMPAAGDAEEVTDESVIVVDTDANELNEMVAEQNAKAEKAMETMTQMQEKQDSMMDEMAEPAVEMQVEETTTETEQAVVETMEEAKEEMAAEMNKSEEMMTDAVEPAAGTEEMVKEEAVETMKEMKSEIMDTTQDMMDDHGHTH